MRKCVCGQNFPLQNRIRHLEIYRITAFGESRKRREIESSAVVPGIQNLESEEMGNEKTSPSEETRVSCKSSFR